MSENDEAKAYKMLDEARAEGVGYVDTLAKMIVELGVSLSQVRRWLSDWMQKGLEEEEADDPD